MSCWLVYSWSDSKPRKGWCKIISGKSQWPCVFSKLLNLLNSSNGPFLSNQIFYLIIFVIYTIFTNLKNPKIISSLYHKTLQPTHPLNHHHHQQTLHRHPLNLHHRPPYSFRHPLHHPHSSLPLPVISSPSVFQIIIHFHPHTLSWHCAFWSTTKVEQVLRCRCLGNWNVFRWFCRSQSQSIFLGFLHQPFWELL